MPFIGDKGPGINFHFLKKWPLYAKSLSPRKSSKMQEFDFAIFRGRKCLNHEFSALKLNFQENRVKKSIFQKFEIRCNSTHFCMNLLKYQENTFFHIQNSNF